MKKTLLYTAIVVAVAVLAVLGYAYSLPARLRVERDTEIAARPALIFAELNDLRRWQNWEAWDKKYDASIAHDYAGPEQGVGAERAWQGDKVGAGRQKITASEPPRRVALDLWLDGSAAPAQAEFNISEFGAGARVKWSLEIDFGPYNPLPRLCASQIEQMIGEDFERGLEKLKALCEQQANDARAAERARQRASE